VDAWWRAPACAVHLRGKAYTYYMHERPVTMDEGFFSRSTHFGTYHVNGGG
jgi:hypothetical protein